MHYITKEDILELHTHIITQTGGIQGVRDAGALESAIAQPRITRKIKLISTRVP